jgi:hypothetical protein
VDAGAAPAPPTVALLLVKVLGLVLVVAPFMHAITCTCSTSIIAMGGTSAVGKPVLKACTARQRRTTGVRTGGVMEGHCPSQAPDHASGDERRRRMDGGHRMACTWRATGAHWRGNRINTSAWGIAPRGSIVAREGEVISLAGVQSRCHGPIPLNLLREAHTRPSHGERWGGRGFCPGHALAEWGRSCGAKCAPTAVGRRTTGPCALVGGPSRGDRGYSRERTALVCRAKQAGTTKKVRRARVGSSPPHRQDRASSFRRPPWVCECVCRSGLKLGVGGKKKSP